MIIWKNTLIKVEESDIVDGVLNIPDEVQNIGFVFDNYDLIKDLPIELFNMVMKKDYYCIDSIESLKEIHSKNMQYINHGIHNCSNLKIIDFPNLNEITTAGICDCDELEKIEFPLLTRLGYISLIHNHNLKEIIVPKLNLKNVEFAALNYNTNLEKIVHLNGEAKTIVADGEVSEIISYRKIDEYDVYYTNSLNNFMILYPYNKEYVVQRNGFSAHGDTIKEAINELERKIESEFKSKHCVEKVKANNKVSPRDYMDITGACELGTQKFMKTKNINWEDTFTIDEVVSITEGFYGHDKFKRLVLGEE